MANNELDPQEKLDYVLDLIARLPPALTHRLADLPALQEELAELDLNSCTGSVHWRDVNKEGKVNKLYILHGTNRTCPLHGHPEPGKRIRIYIGVNRDKIREALASIERQTQRSKLQGDLARHKNLIARALSSVKNIYYSLDYQVSQTDPGIPPYPIETGPVETK